MVAGGQVKGTVQHELGVDWWTVVLSQIGDDLLKHLLRQWVFKSKVRELLAETVNPFKSFTVFIYGEPVAKIIFRMPPITGDPPLTSRPSREDEEVIGDLLCKRSLLIRLEIHPQRISMPVTFPIELQGL